MTNIKNITKLKKPYPMSTHQDSTCMTSKQAKANLQWENNYNSGCLERERERGGRLTMKRHERIFLSSGNI